MTTASGSESSPARLLISCDDRPGIVAAVAGFLHREGANITESSQHSTDPRGGRFYMRMEFVRDALRDDAAELAARFGEQVGRPLALEWRVALALGGQPGAAQRPPPPPPPPDRAWG